MRIMLVFVLALISVKCRTHSDSKLSDSTPLGKDPRVEAFDWVAELKDGHYVMARQLEYCIHNTISREISEGIDFAVNKINAAQTGWKLMKGGEAGDGKCSEDWDILARRPNSQDHLRFRAHPHEAVAEETDAPGHVKIDALEVPELEPFTQEEDALKQDPEVIEAIRALDSARQSKTVLAELNYEKIYEDQFIVSAEIVFNTNPKITWSRNLDTKGSVDPDIVTLHMLGHALRIKHHERTTGDIQEIPCGTSKGPENNKKAIAVRAPATLDLETRIIGDDEKSENISEGIQYQTITVGADKRADSMMHRSIMDPYLLIDSHCFNPTGSAKKEDRINLFEDDIEALKISGAAEVVSRLAPQAP